MFNFVNHNKYIWLHNSLNTLIFEQMSRNGEAILCTIQIAHSIAPIQSYYDIVFIKFLGKFLQNSRFEVNQTQALTNP